MTNDISSMENIKKLYKECLLESGGDVDAAERAVEIILSLTDKKATLTNNEPKWIDIPDNFFTEISASLSNDSSTKQRDIVIHNHVAAPIVNIPVQEPPVVNVTVPVQEPPIVNIAAPIINVPIQPTPIINLSPQVQLPTDANGYDQTKVTRKIVTIKKNADGSWTGMSEEIG